LCEVVVSGRVRSALGDAVGNRAAVGEQVVLDARVTAAWLAFTSTGVPVPSATTVCGSTPVELVSASPRYPMIPGTPDQSSLVVMRPELVQF
jgi:hypothetical protein